jgi:hypothetical protein
MSTQSKENFTIPDTLKNIYNEIAVSPMNLLKNYALNLIHSKIQKYEAENMYYKNKHDCAFEKFKQKVNDMNDNEIFEWEDDLMDWEFAIENVTYWKKKAEELQGE